jgi:hypothetical protein
VGPLTVFDSPVDETADPAFSPDATLQVTPGEGASTLTITVPETWMSDPARVFPVKVDPYVGLTSTADTWVTDYYPNEAYGSYDHLRSGYASLAGNCDSLVKFTLPTEVGGGYVQWAELQLYQFYEGSPGLVRVGKMTKDWSESSTYNSIGTGYYIAGERTRDTSVDPGPYINLSFTEVVQQWADGEPNYGFVIHAPNGDTYRKFYSREYSVSGYRPKLLITYTAPLDVTTYGADGSDQDDDTEAFQDAIDAAHANGGVVKVPAGDYYISGIDIDKSNLVLRGCGTSSVLLPLEDDQESMIHIGGTDPEQPIGYVTVKDLYVRLPVQGDGIVVGGE